MGNTRLPKAGGIQPRVRRCPRRSPIHVLILSTALRPASAHQQDCGSARVKGRPCRRYSRSYGFDDGFQFCVYYTTTVTFRDVRLCLTVSCIHTNVVAISFILLYTRFWGTNVASWLYHIRRESRGRSRARCYCLLRSRRVRRCTSCFEFNTTAG